MVHQEAKSVYCNGNFIDQLENGIFTGLHYELVKCHQLFCTFWDAADGLGNLIIFFTDSEKQKHLVMRTLSARYAAGS